MLNTYGMKMTGLKKASGNTVDWTNGGYCEIFYDTETGEVWTVDQIGNTWTEYHDPAIRKVCNTSKHLTMQEIADRIANRI